MLKQHLHVAMRNILLHPVSFFIHLTGLATGILAALFIYVWVDHELTTDGFHQEGPRIFRLVNDAGGAETLLNTSPRFAAQLADELPEIDLLVHSSWGSLASNLVVDDKVHGAQGEFGSTDFFKLFSYRLLRGKASTCLAAPHGIVLSEPLAIQLFGTTDVIGKRLEWRWYSMTETVLVTGIFEDLPTTSSAQFDYVVSFEIFERHFRSRIDRGNRNGRTFLRLVEGASVEVVNQKIAEYAQGQYPNSQIDPPFLIAYQDRTTISTAFMKMVKPSVAGLTRCNSSSPSVS